MAINEWSTTASSNASGVTGVNWAEGQAPSTVNDSARAMMADVATWYGQASGKINEYLTSVAGTNTITAAGPSALSAYAAGQRFQFIPANTNTGAATIAITPSGASTLAAKNIFISGAALTGGELAANVPASIMYDGTQFHVLASSQRSGVQIWLATKTASNSASLSFTSSDFSFSAFNVYIFELVGILPATDGSGLMAHYSQDGGSNWKTDANYFFSYGGEESSPSAVGSGGESSTQPRIDNVNSTSSNGGVDALLRLVKPSGTSNRKRLYGTATYVDNVATHSRVVDYHQMYVGDTAAINGVRWSFTSGNITSGSIYAYGLKTS